MFKTKLMAKYKVVSVDYDSVLDKMVDNAEKEYFKVDKKLKEAIDEFERLEKMEGTPKSKLDELDKRIEDLDAEREEAEKELEKAREYTVEDLRADHGYDKWKSGRDER